MTYDELLEKIIAKLEEKRPLGKTHTKESGPTRKQTLEDAAAAITGEPTNSVDAIPTIEAPIGTIVKRKELEETAEEPQEVTENDPEKEESTVSKTNEETSKADLSVFMV